MKDWPLLRTQRLLLRPFNSEDASEVRALAGDKDIASTTSAIPHPYEAGLAEAWIATHDQAFQQGKSVVLAITLPATDRVIGAMGLEINQEHRRAEIGYWESPTGTTAIARKPCMPCCSMGSEFWASTGSMHTISPVTPPQAE